MYFQWEVLFLNSAKIGSESYGADYFFVKRHYGLLQYASELSSSFSEQNLNKKDFVLYIYTRNGPVKLGKKHNFNSDLYLLV